MREHTVGVSTYRLNKLSAMQAFHVNRRIMPIIPTLIPIFAKLAKDGSFGADLLGFAEVAEPFARGISELPDDVCNYVFAACLSAVQRQTTPGTWASVWNNSAGVIMFDDLGLDVILELVVEVIKDNLGPFIAGLLTSQQSGPIPAAG